MKNAADDLSRDRSSARSGFRIVEDQIHGFRRLDPIPPEAELSEFYESRYYDLLRKGNRAPDLQRIMQGGNAAAEEVEWLREGPYTDIVDILEEVSPGRRLLEIGCGTGDFISFCEERGFKTIGTEPSQEAAERAAAKGLTVHSLTLDKFLAKSTGGKFDAIVMLNVLEHVPDAVRTLESCRELLVGGGVLCVRVPNDFSEIQLAAQEKMAAEPWWIAVPDHINYFNFASLRQTLDKVGLQTVYVQGDFPMEMFLLMGERYIGNPQIGAECHRRRVEFERSLSPELRRKIYAALGHAGVGRNCVVFAKRIS